MVTHAQLQRDVELLLGEGSEWRGLSYNGILNQFKTVSVIYYARERKFGAAKLVSDDNEELLVYWAHGLIAEAQIHQALIRSWRGWFILAGGDLKRWVSWRVFSLRLRLGLLGDD